MYRCRICDQEFETLPDGAMLLNGRGRGHGWGRMYKFSDGSVPIRGGTCWQTAQAVTLLAHDPRVQYVEGVHYLAESALDGPMSQPYPHGWNLVNGHCVDLLTEFHNWRFGGEDEWLHEPLKVYTLEEMCAGGVSGSIVQKVWMEQHQDRKPQSMAAICQYVFREASDRLERKSK